MLAESYRFYETRQEDAESISNYFVHLASTCDFDPFLERALRDKFVCGPRNENIIKRLLSIGKAFKLARIIESAATDILQVPNKYMDAVNKISENF